MNWEIIIPIIIGLFGGVIGYMAKYVLDKRSESETRIYMDKREHYRNLLLCIKSLSEQKTENIELFYYEYSFLWLHASDDVIRSANELLSIIKSSKVPLVIGQDILGKLLVSMRQDLGLKSKLESSDFIYVQ
ncbi:MAG: hypothetical protein HY960_07580 [Ignavibacteriae bacterium]|nr:hypothetical protein [Ignavibacteriota bacterium]